MSDATQTSPATDRETTEDRRREEIRLYVHQRRAFHIHAGVEVAAMIIIVVVNFATNLAAGIAGEWHAWWSIWALLGMASAVTIHGLVVRMSRPQRPGPTWEDRQVDKILGEV